MLTKKKIIIIIIVVVLLAVIGVVAVNKQKVEATDVQSTEVKRGKVIHKVAASGKVEPVIEVNVSSEVAGRVMKLTVKEGDWVEAGQFLAQLDSTRYLADLERARQVVMSASASLSLAKLEKDQQYELYQKKLVSELVYRGSEARYAQALSSMRQAEANLTQTLDNYSKTILNAPMSGTVTKLNKEVGEMALGSMFQADVILTIADLSAMEILVDVNENDVVDVARGDTAEIKIDALQDTTFYGVVTEIAHSAKNLQLGSLDQVTNFEVKIILLEPPPEIRPGMSAAVDIRTDVHENVLYVPIQAVTMRKPVRLEEIEDDELSNRDSLEVEDDKPVFGKEEPVEVVFVVVDDESGKGKVVRQREVKTGIIGDRDFEILNGLEEGESVVTGPYSALSRGLEDEQAVKVSEMKSFNPNK
jgi:HlyD family secretion protein